VTGGVDWCASLSDAFSEGREKVLFVCVLYSIVPPIFGSLRVHGAEGAPLGAPGDRPHFASAPGPSEHWSVWAKTAPRRRDLQALLSS